MASYTEAKFGKNAAEAASLPTRAGLRRFVSGYFPGDNDLTERLRSIRNAIEESIREEERLKAKALEATGYAKHRTLRARAGGPVGLGWDVIRASIPGLSPQAAEADGIEKDAQPPEPDSRWGPAVHLGAGLAGAGLGVRHAIVGLTETGRRRAIHRLLSAAGKEEGMKKLVENLRAVTSAPKAKLREFEAAIREARGAPLLTKLRSRIAGYFGRAPVVPTPTGAQAKAVVAKAGRRTLAHLRGTKVPWKGKAAIGAAALTVPFFLYNFWKNRAVRAKGGPEAIRAAQKAEHWLGRAEKIRKWRGQQISQMELAGEPTKYKLLPFAG